GVQHDHRRVDALLQHCVHPEEQLIAHLADHVLVDGARLHVMAVPPPVHHHVGDASGGDHARHGRVCQAAADVVHQLGPHFEGGLRDLGAHGVDADRNVLCDERLYDGHHATQFLVPRHTLRSRTGGLAADVDDVGALRDQVEPVLDGLVRIEPGPAVGEGVGGDVDHAHDEASPWRGQTRNDGTGHVTQPYA